MKLCLTAIVIQLASAISFAQGAQEAFAKVVRDAFDSKNGKEIEKFYLPEGLTEKQASDFRLVQINPLMKSRGITSIEFRKPDEDALKNYRRAGIGEGFQWVMPVMPEWECVVSEDSKRPSWFIFPLVERDGKLWIVLRVRGRAPVSGDLVEPLEPNIQKPADSGNKPTGK